MRAALLRTSKNLCTQNVFLQKNLFFLMYPCVWFPHLHRCPRRPEENVGLSGARVLGSCKPFNMDDWKLSLDPPEEPQTVLTSESFLWPLKCLNFRLGNGSRDKGFSLKALDLSLDP